MREIEMKALIYTFLNSHIKAIIDEYKTAYKDGYINYLLTKAKREFLHDPKDLIKQNQAIMNKVFSLKDFGSVIFLPSIGANKETKEIVINNDYIVPVRITNKYDIEDLSAFLKFFGEEGFENISTIKLKATKNISEEYLNKLGEYKTFDSLSCSLRGAKLKETGMELALTYPNLIRHSFIKENIEEILKETIDYSTADLIKRMIDPYLSELKEEISKKIKTGETDEFDYFKISTRKSFSLNESLKNASSKEEILDALSKDFNKPEEVFNNAFELKPSSSKIRDFIEDNNIKNIEKAGFTKEHIYSFLQPINLKSKNSIKEFINSVESMISAAKYSRNKNLNINNKITSISIPKYSSFKKTRKI